MDTLELANSAFKTLAPKAKLFLLAVSGGADSLALFHLAVDLKLSFAVAHYDHALRPESAQDAEFVQALAKNYGVSFYAERGEVAKIAKQKGWNLEDAARRLRYSFLTRIAKKLNADVIVTAHTLNDQTETILMQVLRGAAHLTGIKARQKQILRPLLGINRKQLESYLKTKEQSFLTDQSNFDTSYTRAWLRHEILPQLEKRYPALQQTLARLAQLQQDQLEFLDKQASVLVKENKILLADFNKADFALQRQAIVNLLKNSNLAVNYQQVETLRQAGESKIPKRLSLSKTKSARFAYGELGIVEQQDTVIKSKQIQSAKDLPANVSAQVLAEHPDLVLRTRASGDFMGLSGGTKKLKDILINKKIPREDRDGLLVLAAASEVFWIEGLAVNPNYEVQKDDHDYQFMNLALEQAQQAYALHELPVGAVIVKDKKVISSAHNQTERSKDPSAHAEVLAIRQASQILNDWRLTDCTLYVTLEPCPMCFGAMQQAHLSKLVYAAPNYREGALGGTANLNKLPWKRSLELSSGLLAKPASQLLEAFFKEKRQA